MEWMGWEGKGSDEMERDAWNENTPMNKAGWEGMHGMKIK